MRILNVHNRYQIRGGEDEVCDAEARLLRRMGHTLDLYEEHNDRVAEIGAARTAIRTVWSNPAHHTLQKILSEHPYDLVHVHNFLPLISPAVYYAAKDHGVPVVQTLHNYRLLCPNALFFRNGQVCEDCLGKFIPWAGVQHACYRESRAATGAVAVMLTAHRALSTWNNAVDLYIALTDFARKKFIEGGLPAEKIKVKPNFVDPDPGVGQGQGGYALFVGRLSVEKGLDTLLAAWELLGSQIPLKIVGEGALSSEVQAICQKLPQVEWLGRKPIEQVYQLMGEAMVLVFPSKWYETFGRVAIEAFAKGTPVLAADIGAVAELVAPQQTGLLFRPGDSQDLAAKMEWLLNHPAELAQMRREARREYEAKYTAAKNYDQLMEIYSQARTVLG
jgi:glycosyltransferase involved in cell wall biosynthesis